MHRINDIRVGVDADGRLTEQVSYGDHGVVIHYDDIPESDITTVGGIRVTTPIRTVIDIAAELSAAELRQVMDDCLERRLFTLEEMSARLTQQDMTGRRGAERVRTFIRTLA